MGGCKDCGHEYERHLFGGMCFYCDCKRAVYDTTNPVFLRPHDPAEKAKENTNGGSPARRSSTPRLGNK